MSRNLSESPLGPTFVLLVGHGAVTGDGGLGCSEYVETFVGKSEK